MKPKIQVMIPILCVFLFVSCKNQDEKKTFIDEQTIEKTIAALNEGNTLSADLLARGVRQTAQLWQEEDGTAAEFQQFCTDHFCKTAAEKELLFNRISANFETIFGHSNRVNIELLRPLHVTGYDVLPIDEIFGAYDGLAHFSDDMFNNKIAFIITLNFPFFSLQEKNENATAWSDLEWGYARLGDVFTDRVPAQFAQDITTATANADNYISNYNIYMENLRNDKNEALFPKEMVLISHWGLRDELKSNYANKVNGLEKQQMIYDVMKHIVNQTIPREVINSGDYLWNPKTNKIFKEGKVQTATPETDVRYNYLLNNFKAEHAADAYNSTFPTYISRKFDQEFEISQAETEALFKELVASPQVKEVAQLIEQRLGRKLQPFDIWYDGFKSRSEIDPEKLDAIVMKKYPTKAAFTADLPVILQKFGFTKEKANFICQHVTVDASVGAGHAWESRMKTDNAMLRTRIGEKGMDYKGYNIGVHEFGHNVEQTISLHDVPNYFMTGVPNTAFTEALAFVFQARDLELLGVTKQDETTRDFNTLDVFWGCYEIMGVSLLDMQVWKWMYEHPDCTANELKESVLAFAKEIWNSYYAPVFGSTDQPILAIYSHSIDAPLYLSAYPLGHLINYQLETFLEGKNMGTEIQRIFALGRLTPQVWMEKAVGSKLSCAPLLEATSAAVNHIKNQQ